MYEESMAHVDSIMDVTESPTIVPNNAECRICLMEDLLTNLIKPCKCNSHIHTQCLLTWIRHSNRTSNNKVASCQICLVEYTCACTVNRNSLGELICDLVILFVALAAIAGSLIFQSKSTLIRKLNTILLILGSLATTLVLLRIASRYCIKRSVVLGGS